MQEHALKLKDVKTDVFRTSVEVHVVSVEVQYFISTAAER